MPSTTHRTHETRAHAQVAELQGAQQTLQARCSGLQASADNLRVQALEERAAREAAERERARAEGGAAETSAKLAQIEGACLPAHACV